jgi:DNA-binding phage protein
MGQLAAEAGLGVNTLRNINSSKWNPTARTLSRLESLMAGDAND